MLTILACSLFSSDGRQSLHPDLDRSLDLLAEAWRMLDRFGSDIWPDWQGYRDEAFFLAIPGRQDVLVNPPADPTGLGFFKLHEPLERKPVFLRAPGREEAFGNGLVNLRGDGMEIRAIQFRPLTHYNTLYSYGYYQDILPAFRTAPFLRKLAASWQYRVSLIVHEAFHRFQEQRNPEKTKNARLCQYPGISETEVVLEYREGEGRALAQALQAKKKGDVRRWTRRFLALREQRRGLQEEAFRRWENYQEFLEGGAEYAATRALHLLFGSRIRPRTESVEPSLNNFSASPEDLALLAARLVRSSSDRFTYRRHPIWWSYYSGMAQGLILDRLGAKAWKKRLFVSGEYFESLLQEAVALGNGEEEVQSPGRVSVKSRVIRRGN